MNARTRLARLFGAAAGLILLAGFTTGPPASAAAEASVDEAVISALADDGLADVIVRLREQADLSAVMADVSGQPEMLADVPGLLGNLTTAVDGVVDDVAEGAGAGSVVETLQETVEASADSVEELLRARQRSGQVSDIREFWIFNGFSATIDRDTLDALLAHPDVASVTYDKVIELSDTRTKPFGGIAQLASLGLLGVEPRAWGVERVRAPQAWSKHDTRGEGVVVGVMDSGVDASHPELASSWRGRTGDLAKSWFAPTGEGYTRPSDRRGHGTHVAGTIVSDTWGVAPDTEWIAAKIFRDDGSTTVSIIHAGMQWMLAPGGDPSAAPDVVNSSWGTSATHAGEFWQDLRAWKAAGIVPVFAAGNRGSRSGSVSSPASFPHVVAVGATDDRNRVASFSSRGPVSWNGEQLVKPDLVAPGVRIRSTSNYGGNRLMTGTSMAAPHVSGVAALMRAVNPELSVDEITDALKRSARPGGSKPNNSYGYGLVDAVAALDAVAA